MMEEIIEGVSVSRETLDRLKTYESLVLKWQKTINLISRDSVGDIWHRHILDSAQLFRIHLNDPAKLVDMGSGGGMPGIVSAIILAEKSPKATTTLIESDQRKATFLRTALRECGVQGTVIADRIEAVEPQQADIITARALTDTAKLLHFVKRHMSPDGIAVLHKGKSYGEEVERARGEWHFDLTVHPSLTDSEACLLEIRNIARADP